MVFGRKIMGKGQKMSYHFIDEDRLKLRFPVYEKGKFKKFVFSDFLLGKPMLDAKKDVLKPNQCIGVRDVDGILIYENDILKNHRGEIVVVVWINETASFFLKGIGWSGFDNTVNDDITNYKIIGNVYQNPELLTMVGGKGD